MSVYAGDVHRKRSQVAVVTEDGKVRLNGNTVNGTGSVLRLTGDLPAGTPAASGAASGWGWLGWLLEDYGSGPHLVHPLRCRAIASARGEERQRPARRPWRGCCGRTCCPRRSSRRILGRRSASRASSGQVGADLPRGLSCAGPAGQARGPAAGGLLT